VPEGVLGGAGRAADSEPVTAGRSSGMTDEQIRETVRNARVELDSDENIACYSFIFDPDYADCVPFFDKQKECWDWIGGGDVAKLPVDLFALAPLCLDEARAIRAALEAMPPTEWEWHGVEGDITLAGWFFRRPQGDGAEITKRVVHVWQMQEEPEYQLGCHAWRLWIHGLHALYAAGDGGKG